MVLRPRLSQSFPIFIVSLLAVTPAIAQIDTGVGEESDLGFSSGNLSERGFATLEFKTPPAGSRGFVSRTPSGLELSTNIPFTPTALPQIRSSAPRYGTLRLGRGGKTQVLFDQSNPQSGLFDLLYVDFDRDGDLSNDGGAIHGKVTKDEQRGFPYVEFTAVKFPVYYAQELLLDQSYTFYYWQRPDSEFDRVSYVASSWREGVVKLENTQARVFIYDEDGDGMFLLPNLRWALVPLEEASGVLPELVSIELPLRLGGKPWKIAALMPEGRRVELELETEARVKRALLEVDKTAAEPPRARSDAPVPFAKDYESAKKLAAEQKKPLAIWFATEWSPSCKLMADRTLMDAEVGRLLIEKFAPIAVDFDRESLVAARYEVTAVPTLLLVDSKGNVTDRIVGYRQARAVADLLRNWRE